MNSKTKKALLIVADVVLYLIGFPALVALGYLASMDFIAQNIYGVMAYIPVILAGAMMLICGIVEICFRTSSKRTFKEGRKHRSNFKKQTMKMSIAVVACLCGLMVVFDFALPAVLSDATQGTVNYEDIVANYAVQNQVQRNLVDTFIELNVENGFLTKKAYAEIDKAVANETLSSMTAEEYKATFDSLSKEFRGGTYMYPDTVSLVSAWDHSTFAAISTKQSDVVAAYKAEALDNAEVTALIKNVFNSIDAAYAAFNPLLIECAMENMDFVMASTNLLNDVLFSYVSDSQIRTTKNPATGEKNTGIDTNTIEQDADVLEAAGLDPEDEFLFRWTIMDMLGAVPEDFLAQDMILTVFDIDPANPVTSNARRGALDYMSMAWLDSVSLLGIISIFSMRIWFYIFAGGIAVLTLIRGAIRIKFKKVSDEGDSIVDEENPNELILDETTEQEVVALAE
ncbi:MAG: hypothetical protein PHE93_02225 [Clostridia bacterium]|nr:hypothetical protein [Clostridia bacterium]